MRTLSYPSNGRSFLLIRHAATRLNRPDGDRIRGWRDLPLSVEGERETAELARGLRGSGLRVVVTSDLTRAVQTGRAIAVETGAVMEVDGRLRPWDVGEFTGELSAKVTPRLMGYVERAGERVPGGEAFATFRDRAFAGIEGAMRFAGARRLGIVTHHRVERLVKAWIAAGRPADRGIDEGVFGQRGEAPAHAERVTWGQV